MSANFRDDGEVKRKAIIIREVEEDSAGAGSMVTETVMGIKKGLATLYEQGLGTEVVLNVASQFAVLEQLQGWSTGTGKLAAAGPAPTQAPAATVSIPAPAQATHPKPAPQEQSPAPPAPAAVQTPTGAGEVTLIPPFAIPRKRTPTGELDGPRLSTSELQDALRAAGPADAQQAAAEPPIETNVAEPQIPPSDPTEETLVSSTTRGEESYEEPADGVAAVEALAAAQHEESNAQVPEALAPPEALADEAAPEIPVVSIAQPEDSGTAAPARSEAQAPGIEEAAPVEASAPSPPSEVETSLESGSQPTGAAAPAAMDEAHAPPSEDSEPSGDPIPEPPSFPRAESSTGDVPSWIDGIAGSTDPDLLSDFEFEPEQPEASFPEAKAGELLDDDSMFRPRVIPEERNAKLKTPVELPNANGNQEYAPPQHDGPITIQAPQADTQMFRKVLEGLSGTQVLSGDFEEQADESTKQNGDAVAEAKSVLGENLAAEEGLDELRAKLSEAPVADVPLEAPQAEVTPPSPEELPAVQEPEPEPQPVQAEPASWPPSLPTEGNDWDDELDVTG
jgi:hypothetical protein